jgi:hypothetical protein
MRKRSVLPILCLVFLVGCKASQGGGQGASIKADLAPNLGDYQVTRVAILGIANTAGDEEALQIADYVVQALMTTGMYQFATPEDFERDAKRLAVSEDYERLLRTWQKKRLLDEPVMERVLEKTGYDALIAMEVTRWEEVKLEPSQEGTSDTSVGLDVSMFAIDGTPLWSASDDRTVESRPYLPSFNTRATSSGEAATTATSAVPDPPPIEQVAREVANDVVATLPRIGGEEGGS